MLPQLTAALADRYRIERELGAGGMATVYLAEDLKHRRRVAVKVLRPELAATLGPERFFREIEVAARLQHPHVLPLHDSGEAGGFLYYVMPFVEGESLRERLTRERQLPVADAVRIAGEVASALDYAHRQGVIHRDIKPENILLHDGRALVADFGIALAVSRSDRSARMTETGMSLGTPQYMSPEQAMGERDLDGRTDIYSLGGVLYEMLTGEAPFVGPTAQAIVAKVLTADPVAVAELRRTVPEAVARATHVALQKLPADRFGTAAEFAAALANPSFTTPPSAVRARWRPPVAVGLPWALVLAAGAFIGFDRSRSTPMPPPPAVQRFSIRFPEQVAWTDESGAGLALSPDGTMLAHTGRDSTSQRRLYLRSMDRADPVPIVGAESAGLPFFSPDGRWLGFVAQGIEKILVAGGAPEFVCKVPGYVNATWLESNVIVFGDGTDFGLRQCSLRGEVTTLLASDSGESFNFPHGLPGDRGVIFSVRRGPVERLAVLDLRTRTRTSLEIVGTDPRYVATGHVVYLSPDGLVRAVPFDLKELAPTGEPRVIAEGVPIGQNEGALMAVSRGGIVVAAGQSSSQRALELVDRAGTGQRLYPRLGSFLEPQFSPNGRQIAVALEGEIWLVDRAQEALTRLSHDSLALRPFWTPDGRQVAYVRQTGARVELRIMPADGTAPAKPLFGWPNFSLWEGLFTPDGGSLVVRTTGGPLRREMWLVSGDSAAKPISLLASAADEVAPAVSPDGRWLAYASNESGHYEVYVRSFPGMGARYPVSLDGGTEPVWSRRGNELFYRSGPKLLAAEVRTGTGTGFEVVRRTVLFSNSDYEGDPTHAGYDVAPDGAHFVMVRNLGGASFFTVTLNQFLNLTGRDAGAVHPGRAP